jgi:DNA polymerase I
MAGRRPAPWVDTLTTARLILPNLSDLDDQAGAMGDPPLGKLRGRYSIEAWGARLGIPKIGTDIEDWSHWTPEMQERCAGDVAICKALWHFLKPDGYSQQAIELEHRAAAICDEITAAGAPFDTAAAARLHQQWTERRSALVKQLQQQFPGTKLSSRKQIGALLEARGWVPEQRTEKTKQPKISAELLETIPEIYPEFAGLAEYMVLSARLASLATGKKAWSTHIGADGRIHGGIIHIGTPHSRAKHLEPNLAQVPNPKKGSPFGAECRALFHSSNGFVCVTADQAGLQDRGFAHYLSDFDAGAYAKTFANGASGDTHWQSATVLGLVPANTVRNKENKVHTMIREGSKRFRYAFLYGAGASRAGHIIYDTARATGNGLLQQFFGDSPRPNEAALKRIGGSARKKFIAATPGLGRLLARLNTDAKKHEWLPGLDGRRVPVRAFYTALNYIVCSSEAIICKRWLVRVYDELCARFRYGWDGDAVIALWVHDELVVYCRPEIADQVGEILVRNAKEPAEFYGFKVPLDADYKIGRSWAGEPGTTESIEESLPLEPARDVEPAEYTPEVPISQTRSDEHTLGNPRRRIDPGIRHGNGAHPQVRGEDHPRVAVAGKVSTLHNGIDCAPESLEERLARIPLADLIGERPINGKISCPFHEDETPSLHVYRDHYYCFGCHAYGNHLDWLREVEGLDDDAAVDVLLNWQGRTTSSRRDNDEQTLKLAAALWQAAKPISGTPAERYLADIRGIDIAALPAHVPLRFHPKCTFGTGKQLPCLLALYQDIGSDEPAGIHRVALTPEIMAGGEVERRSLGRWSKPRAIKLWPATTILYLGEGIETVLAAATRLPYRDGTLMQPAWAAVSTGGISKFPVLPDVHELRLLLDHDIEGEACAVPCRERWEATGRKVTRLRPLQPGYDFNDVVLEKLRATT